LKKYKSPSVKAPYSSIPAKVTVGWRSDGVEQQIWTDGNKNYLWYGPENRYIEARYDLSSRSWQVLF
jgi:hypothetical protein